MFRQVWSCFVLVLLCGVWWGGCGESLPPLDEGPPIQIVPEGAAPDAAADTTSTPRPEPFWEAQPEPASQEPVAEKAPREPLDAGPDGVVDQGPLDVGPSERVSVLPEGTERWIGHPCQRDSECNYTGGICYKEADGYPGGSCSLACTRLCPDKAGEPTTFCIADQAGKGHCVSQCPGGMCRAGYECVARSRVNQSSTLRDVCVPKRSSSGPSRTFLYIGASQSSGTNLSKVLIEYFRDPGKYCNAKTQNNKVYSYTRPSSAARHWSARTGSNKDWLCRQTRIWTNGTASSDTTGPKLCAGITQRSRSPFEGLIDRHMPDTFLIQLGDNSLGFSETYVKDKIKALLDQVPSGSVCMWVTPTYGVGTDLQTKKKRMEGWIRDALKAYTRLTCHLLTSYTEMSMQTTCQPFNVSDGLHLTSCGARLMGEALRKKICALGLF